MSDVINKTETESAVKKTSETASKNNTSLKKKTLPKKSAKKSTKKTAGKGRNFPVNLPLNFDNKAKLGLAVIAVLLLVLIFGVSSCGVSHKSPKGVVNSLIESYAEGKEKKALKCFGSVKDATDDLKKEVSATIKYFDAHNAKKVEVDACDILSENNNYTYVYIIYHFVMEDEQIYPCISTYMVKNESGKYYVVPPSEVTAEMSEQAVVDYEKFMTTDIYKKYTQEYETFTKKNPGYEEKIASKIS